MALSTQASLVSTAGGLGVYDTVNNVTWTSDGNLFATQAASYSGGSSAYVAAIIAASGGVISDTPNTLNPTGTYTLSAVDFDTTLGWLDWWGAKAWVNYLNATGYAGSKNWALPTTVDCACSSGWPDGSPGNPDPSSSQLAQLFYDGLGQVAGQAISSTHSSSYALFTNLQDNAYWSGTEYSSSADQAWLFTPTDPFDVTFSGIQGVASKDYTLFNALAVTAGDITEVPEPGVVWLLGSGVMGVLGLRRRKTQASLS